MKKLATVAIMSAALLGSQIANAHHVPPPSGPMSGTVIVAKGLEFECVLGMNFSPSGTDPNSGSVTISLSPGDDRCTALKFENNPYSYAYNPTNHEVTVYSVDVTTITFGNCFGNISADYDGTGLLINAMLPTATPPSPDCYVVGYID